MVNETHKICFVGLYDEKNYGDPIIAYCTEWLFKQSFGKDYIPVHLSLDYIEKQKKSLYKRALLKMLCLTGIKRFGLKNRLVNEYIAYFNEKLYDVDLVIVVGGGLIKYYCQDFTFGITGLLTVAEKYKIPVVFNSVGVEGYDENNECCQLIKKALKSSALYRISTRDDIEILYNDYFDGSPNIPCEKVCDPAVWTSEAYNIKKNGTTSIIGIGIGRGGLFADNGKDYTSEQFFNLYIEIIEKLYFERKEVRLFTNGLDADNQFAFNIKKKLEEKNIFLNIDIPSSPRHLVENISHYSAIIAARLHSCIVAYSLNIPAIGLVWNDKLFLWGKNINAEMNYILVDNLNSNHIISQLKRAMSEGYDTSRRSLFRQTIKTSMDNICALIDINNK